MMPVPMTMEGRIKLLQESRPDTGNQPRWTEKYWMPIRPSQKPGAESPQMASNMPIRSTKVPRLMAQMTPMKMPAKGAQTSPAHTS